jgi:Uma2 family endonuclease
VDEYRAMVAAGVFHKKSRLHLINGLLVKKMTQNPPHSTADTLLSQELDRKVLAGWHVRESKPILLQESMPEPDRTIVRGSARDYSKRDPGPRDVGLVIEVSDSSLAEDRLQAAIYAREGIPAYWIVNINQRWIEVYEGPGAAGYERRTDFLPGQAVPLMLDGGLDGEILVDDVLP